MYIRSIAGLLEKLINEAGAEKRRKHREQMATIKLISDSSLRDAYVQQLLLNQFFLNSSEKAQEKLQNAAKHAQWLAEKIGYHRQEHGATPEQIKDIATQLRFLAVNISRVDSVDDLQVIYKAATLFTDQVSQICHKEVKDLLVRSSREGILNPLNDCIAIENNLRHRIAFTVMGENITLKLDSPD